VFVFVTNLFAEVPPASGEVATVAFDLDHVPVCDQIDRSSHESQHRWSADDSVETDTWFTNTHFLTSNKKTQNIIV